MPSLDGIRAASFLIVFLAHAGLDSFVPGGFGVTVFFFLSGYLITTLLRLEYDEHGTVGFRQFYLRRVLRIMPPFYLVLVLSTIAAAVGLVPGGFLPRAVASQAAHFANYRIVRHGYEGMPAGTGVYWSLAVEEHFYLAFPCIYLFLRRYVRRPLRQAAFLWAACGAILCWRCLLVYHWHSPPDRTYVATDARADSILFGCALAIWGNPVLDDAGSFARPAWLRVLLPASLLLLLVTFLFREPSFRETFRYTLQGIALYPIFLGAARYPQWLPFRVFNTRAMSFLGVLSYSLYLVHHVVLDAIGTGPSFPVRASAGLLVSVGCAWVIYEVIEKPCARARRRLSLQRAVTPPVHDACAPFPLLRAAPAPHVPGSP